MIVGVLALQGGFAAHRDALRQLGHEVIFVRYAEQLDGLDGLVLPGGESSTQLKLLDLASMSRPLDEFVRAGKPVLATCAGVILAAARVRNPEQRAFGWLDVDVSRNGWGRQADSFQAVADDSDVEPIFIRAPRIERVGDAVEVVLTFAGEPILVRQGQVTGATFHPELTADRRIHAAVFGGEA